MVPVLSQLAAPSAERLRPESCPTWRCLSAAERSWRSARRQAVLGHARLFLVELLRDAPALPKASAPVRAALAFLERRHHLPISLRDAAKAVHYSARQVAERVRRETGQAVGDWLRLFRLAHARQLLRDSELSIDAVALEVGDADAAPGESAGGGEIGQSGEGRARQVPHHRGPFTPRRRC
jgi:AraC-like DNA-binding protein